MAFGELGDQSIAATEQHGVDVQPVVVDQVVLDQRLGGVRAAEEHEAGTGGLLQGLDRRDRVIADGGAPVR